MRTPVVGWMLLCACASLVSAATMNPEQNLTLDRALQIPGIVLTPGNYRFSIEDSMGDRTVVRIEDLNKSTHYLVLVVPNPDVPLQSAENGLILFRTKDENTQVLKAWICPGCATTLEFVYSKLEAMKITADSGESVLAADPGSDRLPPNLSADDTKVVTLWLLSPKRVTAERGDTLTAENYTSGNGSAKSERRRPAEVPGKEARLGEATRVGEQEGERGLLPKTASNTFSLGLWGVMALLAAGGMRIRRLRNSRE